MGAFSRTLLILRDAYTACFTVILFKPSSLLFGILGSTCANWYFVPPKMVDGGSETAAESAVAARWQRGGGSLAGAAVVVAAAAVVAVAEAAAAPRWQLRLQQRQRLQWDRQQSTIN